LHVEVVQTFLLLPARMLICHLAGHMMAACCTLPVHTPWVQQCLMLVHVGSQDQGVGTPIKYLARTNNWNAYIIYIVILIIIHIIMIITVVLHGMALSCKVLNNLRHFV